MPFGHLVLVAFIALFTAFFTVQAQAGDLPAPIAAALSEAGLPDSHVGVFVQEIGADQPALAFGETRSFNPASVMKLLTTLAALDGLGPAHTFKTRVLTRGSLADGVLYGDLILQGGGDPGLTRERFWLLLREMRAHGLREIRGDVLIDEVYYQIPSTDPAEFDQAPLKPYNAAPTALLVNYNALPLRLTANGGTVGAQLDPGTLIVDNRLQLLRERPCNGWQDGLAPHWDGTTLRLEGGFPEACGEKVTWLNLMPPLATVETLFRAYWRELGGTLEGRVRAGAADETALPLMEFESPPLAQIVRDINKYSNNVMAKMLFLDLGAVRQGAPGTWAKGERAVRDWLAAKSIRIPELVLENGSGLSRIERISAASMARLLLWASGQPVYHEFAASLPALGLEGTQRRRLADSPLAGRAWLKSGTLNGTRALAGYLMDAQGRRKVLVLFINHAQAANTDRVQEAVLRWAMEPPAPMP